MLTVLADAMIRASLADRTKTRNRPSDWEDRFDGRRPKGEFRHNPYRDLW